MKVFDAYGQYYNLLYQDKDYAGEVAYLRELIDTYSPGAEACMNLGCGTGNHDFILTESGMDILGVDLSDQMIAVANERLKEQNVPNLRFKQGDIRSLAIEREFDVVLALFHVVSYQNSDQEVQDSFSSVAGHLKPGGIFIFDTWYGPAVLEQRPENRVKEMENDEIYVIRKATPVLDVEKHIVEVHYELDIRDKNSEERQEVKEEHHMRYFFKLEIEDFLHQYGLELIHSEETMSKKELSNETWSSLFVAKKIGE